MAHRLRNIVLKELSLVDKPANDGARVLLAKRDDSDVEKDMYGVSRFAEVLQSVAYLMQSSEYEAESEADGSTVPAALRSWLKDGTKVFASMAKEEVAELVAALRQKREFSASERRSDAKSGAAESDGSYPIENSSDLKNAMRAYGRSKNKAKTKAHIRARARALGLESMLTDAFKADDDNASAAGNAVIHEGDDEMSPDIAKALGLAADATAEKVIEAIGKMALDMSALKVDLEIAKAGMTDAEKAYHDGLKEASDRAAFRAASREDRAVKMAKRDDLPEHVRKALDEAADLKKRLAALEGKEKATEFSKRAVEIGLTEKDGEMLRKAHDGDKESLAKLESIVKGLTEQVRTGKVFAEFGKQGPKTDGVSAYDQIVAKGEELRAKDSKLTKEQAFAKVYEDPANRELVEQYKSESASA